MQFPTALLGLLAASHALAAPAADASSANAVTVTLRGPGELATQTQLGPNEQKRPVGAGGAGFTSVELMSHHLQNDKGQDLRCRLFDARGRPVTVTRGANVDTTFSDAGKGAWTFRQTAVSKVQCSPAFAAAPQKRDVVVEERANGPLRVTLSGPSELATQTGIGEKDAKAPVGSRGPYSQVTLNVGAGRKAARCQLIDPQNKVVTLVRGANVDVTFGDGGKGPWKAQNGKNFHVKEIKCDPSFKSRN